VLVAIVALAALCVLGIGALIYFKMKLGNPGHGSPDPVSSGAGVRPAPSTQSAPVTDEPSVTSPPSPLPTATPSATDDPPPPASATASAPASASLPTTAATAASTAPPGPVRVAPSSGSATTAPTQVEHEDPGFLTIVCNPSCDDVVDQGRSLGPA